MRGDLVSSDPGAPFTVLRMHVEEIAAKHGLRVSWFFHVVPAPTGDWPHMLRFLLIPVEDGETGADGDDLAELRGILDATQAAEMRGSTKDALARRMSDGGIL